MKILVNSLPKSGTHLLTSLLVELGFSETKPGLTGALLRETHRNPYTNWKKRQRKAKAGDCGFRIDLDIDTSLVSSKWLSRFLDQIPDNTFVSGHLPYSKDLSDFLIEKEFKILYIIRDPRDVLNSYINYQKKGMNLPFHHEFNSMDLDACIAHTLQVKVKNNLVTSSLYQRLDQSIGWINDDSVHATSFEKLIGPQGGGNIEAQLIAIKQILLFLEFNGNVETVIKCASTIFNPGSSTFHKGLIGQWKEVFSAEQQKYINNEIGNFIERLGYK